MKSFRDIEMFIILINNSTTTTTTRTIVRAQFEKIDIFFLVKRRLTVEYEVLVDASTQNQLCFLACI